MNRPSDNNTARVSQNKTFLSLTALYLLLLMLIAVIACFFAYRQRREELFSQMDLTYMQMQQDYQDTLDNFWQIYMPIYENKGTIHDVLQAYFTTDVDPASEPFAKLDLKDALQQMIIRDSQAQWIALYSDTRDINYILFNTGGSIRELPADFPYLDNIRLDSSLMEVYGMEPIVNDSNTIQSYAICGGIPSTWGRGKILVGYSTSSLEQICKSSISPLESLSYQLRTGDELIYDSSGSYDKARLYLPDGGQEGIRTGEGGRKLYVRSGICGNRFSVISYNASWQEIFLYSHKFTLPILLIVLLFAGLSIILYLIMLQMITKEVNVIREGLNDIGENHLDRQIPTGFKQSGLSEIAESINHMTVRLSDNINRAYYYELKQKEAELSELQAKFNPHFLYNSLEMLCSRCYQSGDTKTAELITQLSAIFRGFIGSKTFIPLQDELAFSKRYLALFGARYGNRVKVRYNFEKGILRCSIIRNVFQPLIENYFVHGFEVSEEDNYILFSGRSLDEKTMLITVEDNGCGMEEDELEELNARLHEPIQLDTESYGLKNLHQRLRLFYGEDCGLSIVKNSGRGITIRMTLLKLTCEDIEKETAKHAAGTHL